MNVNIYVQVLSFEGISKAILNFEREPVDAAFATQFFWEYILVVKQSILLKKENFVNNPGYQCAASAFAAHFFFHAVSSSQ